MSFKWHHDEPPPVGEVYYVLVGKTRHSPKWRELGRYRRLEEAKDDRTLYRTVPETMWTHFQIVEEVISRRVIAKG